MLPTLPCICAVTASAITSARSRRGPPPAPPARRRYCRGTSLGRSSLRSRCRLRHSHCPRGRLSVSVRLAGAEGRRPWRRCRGSTTATEFAVLLAPSVAVTDAPRVRDGRYPSRQYAGSSATNRRGIRADPYGVLCTLTACSESTNRTRTSWFGPNSACSPTRTLSGSGGGAALAKTSMIRSAVAAVVKFEARVRCIGHARRLIVVSISSGSNSATTA